VVGFDSEGLGSAFRYYWLTAIWQRRRIRYALCAESVILSAGQAEAGELLERPFSLGPWLVGPCLDSIEILEFFRSLSITSIFTRMHEALNVDKKNN
jgi:hypothetical protein